MTMADKITILRDLSPHLLFLPCPCGAKVELTHNLRYNWPQLGQHKYGGVEDACVTPNIRWSVILRELICDTVEGLGYVAEF